MKSSSNILKAERIIAKLCLIRRNAVKLTVDNIINKCKDQAELDFYYGYLCEVRT